MQVFCATDFLLGPHNADRAKGRGRMIILPECLSMHGHYLEPLTLVDAFFTLLMHREADHCIPILQCKNQRPEV